MPRPKCCRRIGVMPGKTCFQPEGVTPSFFEEVVLTLDEYESIRLADFEGLYQEQAASRMNISRQTFGRIVEAAHRKVADVLVTGKALKIEGGPVSMKAEIPIRCPRCKRTLSPGCGIDVLRGCSGEVKKVAEGWLAGNLKDSGIACDLHAHECHEA